MNVPTQAAPAANTPPPKSRLRARRDGTQAYRLSEESHDRLERARHLANLVATGMAYTVQSNEEIRPAEVLAFATTIAELLNSATVGSVQVAQGHGHD